MLSAYFALLHKNIAFKAYNNQNTEHITVLRTADRSLMIGEKAGNVEHCRGGKSRKKDQNKFRNARN
jgi:hypothetical protein